MGVAIIVINVIFMAMAIDSSSFNFMQFFQHYYD
jgi:hypothetical protein